jgi:hypothetical protein
MIDKDYRKRVRNFKGRIELMNKIPKEKSLQLFFELCDIFIKNYIKTEKERFPNKSIRDIIIDMHKKHEKIKRRNLKNGSEL